MIVRIIDSYFLPTEHANINNENWHLHSTCHTSSIETVVVIHFSAPGLGCGPALEVKVMPVST